MEMRSERDGLQVDAALARFVEEQALPGTGVSGAVFWKELSALIHELGPENRALLERREDLQEQIDAWHTARAGQPHDHAAYTTFLRQIGYLLPEGPDFTLETGPTDPEIARQPGPQLVVPIMNARYALNAANARWGSLYDALYGTDALGDLPAGGGYDPARGARVVAWAKAFLDEAVPLSGASWADVTALSVADGALKGAALADPLQFAGHIGDAAAPDEVILQNNNLHIRIVIDPSTPVGKTDPAGISDLILEAALSSIMDCEDSVAAVDGEDKALAYRNWLGLMKGDLTEQVAKGGGTITRRLNGDVAFTAQAIAIGDQPLQAHRPPGRQRLGADAHLSAKAVAETVGKPR